MSSACASNGMGNRLAEEWTYPRRSVSDHGRPGRRRQLRWLFRHQWSLSVKRARPVELIIRSIGRSADAPLTRHER